MSSLPSGPSREKPDMGKRKDMREYIWNICTSAGYKKHVRERDEESMKTSVSNQSRTRKENIFKKKRIKK